jgi:hypothetical protein
VLQKGYSRPNSTGVWRWSRCLLPFTEKQDSRPGSGAAGYPLGYMCVERCGIPMPILMLVCVACVVCSMGVWLSVRCASMLLLLLLLRPTVCCRLCCV